jgi:hypothetical protein
MRWRPPDLLQPQITPEDLAGIAGIVGAMVQAPEGAAANTNINTNTNVYAGEAG